MEGAPKEISQTQKRRNTAGFVVLILVALVVGIIIGLVSPKMIVSFRQSVVKKKKCDRAWRPLSADVGSERFDLTCQIACIVQASPLRMADAESAQRKTCPGL